MLCSLYLVIYCSIRKIPSVVFADGPLADFSAVTVGGRLVWGFPPLSHSTSISVCLSLSLLIWPASPHPAWCKPQQSFFRLLFHLIATVLLSRVEKWTRFLKSGQPYQETEFRYLPASIIRDVPQCLE